MKYLGSIFFLVMMVWTWNSIHSVTAIPFETHAGLQNRLAELIKSTLAEKKPDAQNLEITKLWTEPLSDSKVKAFFSYKYFEPSTDSAAAESRIEGEVILERRLTENSEQDPWTILEVKTTVGEVSFSDGIVVNMTDTPEKAIPVAPEGSKPQTVPQPPPAANPTQTEPPTAPIHQ